MKRRWPASQDAGYFRLSQIPATARTSRLSAVFLLDPPRKAASLLPCRMTDEPERPDNAEEPPAYEPEDIEYPPLEILYRDDHYIAIHKPNGMLVHRTSMDRHATQVAIQLLRDQIGQRVSPVHRLDRPVSGLLLFALTDEALGEGMKLFENRKVEKTYLAIVRGWSPDSDAIDYPLAKFADDDARQKTSVTQTALTTYRTLSRSELSYPTDRYATSRFSLVELHPHTGRRHQLRRHLAHIRHPIIGDTRHGDNTANKHAKEHFNIQRNLLASTELRFTHPITGESLHLTCPLADNFQSALEAMQLSLPEDFARMNSD